ncbi:MAG: hypothetical protein ACXVKH_13525 [Candidatus Angelobacter sp.]
MIDHSGDLIAKSRNLLLRWLAACTGLVAVSGGAMTSLYLPFPIMLIVGAAILGKWPRTGRWLIWIGASVLSVCLLPAYVVLLGEMHFAYVDFLIFLIDIGWIGTLILLPLCDVILVIDAFKRRQAKIPA